MKSTVPDVTVFPVSVVASEAASDAVANSILVRPLTVLKVGLISNDP